MEPLTLILLGAGGYFVYKKNENPEWSPLTWLCSSPYDKHVALERVKVASVPTPAVTVALDPGMSTDQVKQVNHSLTTETDHEKIKAHADALDALGHTSSAAALGAKAQAVGEAKAHGASDAEIHGKQIEAQAPAPAVGWGPYASGADAVFGTQSYGYPWAEVSYDYSMHPEHMAGIQSGPAIVGIQSGPAIVGVQSGPAIVGWDGRERFGRHGRFAPHRGRERFEQRRPEWEHHRRRHHYRPEEMMEQQPMMEEPEPIEENIEVPEEVHVEHEHHHHHHDMPLPPPPPQPGVVPGVVTNGDWMGYEDMVGLAQYGGGGLVAEYPGMPQQAQPYGAPVGQYQQQQAYAPQLPYGADVTQQYAQPQQYAQQYQQQYAQPQQYAQYPQYEAVPEAEVIYQPEYRHRWGGRGYGGGYRHYGRRW
jgi:hypothetical protein